MWRHEHSQAMAERSGRRSVMRQLDVERGVQRSDRDKRALAEHVILHTADTYWPYEKRRPGPKLPTPEEYNAALDEQCESNRKDREARPRPTRLRAPLPPSARPCAHRPSPLAIRSTVHSRSAYPHARA